MPFAAPLQAAKSLEMAWGGELLGFSWCCWAATFVTSRPWICWLGCIGICHLTTPRGPYMAKCQGTHTKYFPLHFPENYIHPTPGIRRFQIKQRNVWTLLRWSMPFMCSPLPLTHGSCSHTFLHHRILQLRHPPFLSFQVVPPLVAATWLIQYSQFFSYTSLPTIRSCNWHP